MLQKIRLPKNAKRVFKGVIFDVYQWPQKRFDNTTATFEMLKRPDTLQVIAVTPDKKILILKEQQPTKKPFLGLPGGRIDPGETPLEGAERELREETGCVAERWRLWYDQRPYSKIDWTIFVYIARGLKKVAPLTLDAGEKISVTKIPFARFLKLADNKNFHEPHLKTILLRARFIAAERAKLKELLFG